MASLKELREGAATALGVIPGLQAHGRLLTSGYLPSAYVVPGEIDYHKAMGNGHSDYNLVVELHVATLSDIGGQDQLDEFLSESGDRSVKAALEADPTLGGLAQSLVVQGVRDWGFLPRPATEPALGARILFWVMARGN
jgi:hypothetical protein